MRANYSIHNCRGDFITSIVVDATGDIAEDEGAARCDEVLAESGYKCRSKCGSCGDDKFRARFNEYVGSVVNELYFNFASGEVAGSIFGANRYDLIAALEAVATALRAEDGELRYLGYDEGKISVG
jgi:citrate lyase alpha subunit